MFYNEENALSIPLRAQGHSQIILAENLTASIAFVYLQENRLHL